MWFISRLADWAAKVLLPLGGQGLFVAAAMDSSFVPLPEAVDLWLITLSVLQPHRMPYYIVSAVAGSLLGCCILYSVARWSEEKFVETNPRYKDLPRIRRFVDKYGFLAVLVGSVLPPPMPFKSVVIAAGLGKARFDRFVAAVVIGRGIRYSAQGILAVRYGNKIWPVLLKVGPYVFCGMIVVIASIAVVYIVRRSRKCSAPETARQAKSSSDAV
ncbi:MAG: VTT domain-containing protein [Acidobacteria bacterium]|nr:VTT domain-containing protein [Acidobacteriota bacterium]